MFRTINCCVIYGLKQTAFSFIRNMMPTHLQGTQSISQQNQRNGLEVSGVVSF